MIVFNKASEIAAEIVLRLGSITKANGFSCDIGTLVFQGRRNISDDSVPCCALIEGADQATDQDARMQAKIVQDYVVCGYVRCDPDNPNVAAHGVIRDIKRVIFSDGPRWGGKIRQVRYEGRDIGPRADGEAIVLAQVHFSVEYAETLADA